MVYDRLATGGELEATTAGLWRNEPMKQGTADTRSARRGWAERLKTGAMVSMRRSIMLPVEYGGVGEVGTRAASLPSLPLATPTAAATVAWTFRRCRDLGLRRGCVFSFLSLLLFFPLSLLLLSLKDTRFSEPDLDEPDRDRECDFELDLDDLDVDLER